MAHPQPKHDGQGVQEEEEEYHPWYLHPEFSHPFKLARKITLGRPDAAAFRNLAIFPWDSETLQKLWDGTQYTPEIEKGWKQLVAQYWDAVAVTSDYSLHIFFTQQKKNPLSVRLPEDEQKLLETDTMCVAWAINLDKPLEPLVLFSRGSVLYSYNPERLGINGFMRGHGAAITSIAVHPTVPQLVCTTSRDYTTRIYDLRFEADILVEGNTLRARDKKVDNPVWPPVLKPSLAGAAHGLRLPVSEQEGRGMGRCIGVLMGGRSGGHQAAVLSAAFHPTLPLIATCGDYQESSSFKIISTHAFPKVPSQLIAPRLNLFQHPYQDPLILLAYPKGTSLTIVNPRFMKPRQPYPFPSSIKEKLLGGANHPPPPASPPESEYGADMGFGAGIPPDDVNSPFALPQTQAGAGLSKGKERARREEEEEGEDDEDDGGYNIMRLSGPDEELDHNDDESQDDDDEATVKDGEDEDTEKGEEDDDDDEDEEGFQEITDFINRRPNIEVPPIQVGWSIGLEQGTGQRDEGQRMMACAMGVGGRIIVGVGTKGTVWVWRNDS
ncbi:hypothetical protein BDN70DRAFT_931236 [Pholiota conissans]|uniref:WD40 repeat-like protein n=1 Tax=Pholiota conissans TaxID=109636 RepID=A0A9P6D2C9_9AGAR|nr:hypothetical protein BDN70DRAFT_931236 [Pholiota conissans]